MGLRVVALVQSGPRVVAVDVRVGAYAVIVRDGDLLLTHWNENGRTGWTLPGGGLEDYETAEQAAVREVREETGYDVESAHPARRGLAVHGPRATDGAGRPARCTPCGWSISGGSSAAS